MDYDRAAEARYDAELAEREADWERQVELEAIVDEARGEAMPAALRARLVDARPTVLALLRWHVEAAEPEPESPWYAGDRYFANAEDATRERARLAARAAREARYDEFRAELRAALEIDRVA